MHTAGGINDYANANTLDIYNRIQSLYHLYWVTCAWYNRTDSIMCFISLVASLLLEEHIIQHWVSCTITVPLYVKPCNLGHGSFVCRKWENGVNNVHIYSCQIICMNHILSDVYIYINPSRALISCAELLSMASMSPMVGAWFPLRVGPCQCSTRTSASSTPPSTPGSTPPSLMSPTCYRCTSVFSHTHVAMLTWTEGGDHGHSALY